MAFLGLVLVTAFLSPAPADAGVSWGGYHWARTANPFVLPLGNNLTPGSAWDACSNGTTTSPCLPLVSADWSASSVLDTVIVPGKGGNCGQPRNGDVEVCNGAYGFNGWLGYAQLWVSGLHITKATARVNDTYFNDALYNTPGLRRHVLCHEIGHTLGLDHETIANCMNELLDPTLVSPDAGDYLTLASIYAHLDNKSTVASVSATSASVQPSAVGDFGRPVPTGRARETLFVRDAGGGEQLFTWVFWADDHAAGPQ